MRAWFRAIRQFVLAWLYCATWIPLMIVLLAVTIGRRKDTLGTALMRAWGRTMLRISSVQLQVDAEVRTELQRRRARVVTFNHSSSLDLFVGAALMPEGGVTIAKRELLYLPLIGQVVLLLDVVFLDRGNRERAMASLRAIGERVRRESLTVMIAPEGTRSKGPGLGPFKLGAFHLAIEAGVPIVPLVMRGCAKVWAHDAWYCTPGTVRVSLLPEIPTAGLDASEVRHLADTLRADYALALSQA